MDTEKNLELRNAIEKYNDSKKTTISLTLDFHHFILSCYNRLKPCAYGGFIQKKIAYEIGGLNISANKNKGDIVLKDTYYEVKTSFLGKSGCYRLTHIRSWQDFNYYLICFIDCENDFKPELYILEKSVINNLSLTPMNGTGLANSSNVNIDNSVSVKKNGNLHQLIKENNLLSGTDIKDLIEFSKTNKLF
jgi:hypothetical protein